MAPVGTNCANNTASYCRHHVTMSNRTSSYRFTVIVPLYNEEENIPALEERLGSWLPKCSVSACALFVDDGSSDGSLALLKDICARHDNFFYISFVRNAGLSAALGTGVQPGQPVTHYVEFNA